ncbi:MAG: DNA alkylation repair protein [Myxococcota bacterium]
MDDGLIESFVGQAMLMLERAADPGRAPEMAAYMKTKMPFWGVQTKERDRIVRALKRAHPIEDAETYEGVVRALWQGTKREDKYIAVRVARAYPRFVSAEMLKLYEELVREGAWWDFVDEIAIHLVGGVIEESPNDTLAMMDQWLHDDDMWIRRTALLCQLKRKERTDDERLFAYCAARMREDEFFIRKAIGWALREYSKTAPQSVAAFVNARRGDLSGLSFREATKVLRKRGWTF